MKKASAADRVRQLLRERWNGNQSEMARDIKCAPSTLSLVASGKKEPGKRLLTLIAAHPRINSDWLFHGTGMPLTDGDPLATSAFSTLPVSRQVIGDLRSAKSDAFLDERQEVVPRLENPQSYFLRVEPGEPILNDPELGIRPGDRLLLDLTPDSILKPERLRERLCVVRHPNHPDLFTLGMVTYVAPSADDGPERLEVDTFDLGVDPHELVPKKHVKQLRGKQITTIEYFRRVQQGKETRLERVSHLELEPSHPRISYEDVVGICKMLLRKF